MPHLLTLELRDEQDVMQARQRARQIAELLGFDPQNQTRIAAAVSEIARNAFQHGGDGSHRYGDNGQGEVTFSLTEEPPFSLHVAITDQGAGIADIDAVIEGRSAAVRNGAGQGIGRARRLMDDFSLQSVPGQGTKAGLIKRLPPAAQPDFAAIAAQIAKMMPPNPYEESQRQNRELLRALEELHEQQAELAQLNRELSETNRGVVALYAELEEQALAVQRASELKSRFLSYMSHEFRTPVSSIISIARMLQERVDGDLTPEQEKQVRLIQGSSDALWEMVNDLLDLARIEAGKTRIAPQEVVIADIFSALRGMFRPLLGDSSPELLFEQAKNLPETIRTDEGKLSQILRNFISNALKFTPSGAVRVVAEPGPEGTVVFSVSDTGIGIAPENLERIFEEFTQVESAQQNKVKGTGLGLPLSKKLAELLGGSVAVHSEPGAGSTFTVTLPVCWTADGTHCDDEDAAAAAAAEPMAAERAEAE